MIKNINLFGGPGVAKSTIAGGLFHQMKIKGYNVEYIQEYAKDLVYGDDNIKLSDQLLILGKQHHRLFKLNNNVDYAIHDSPFLLGILYYRNNKHLNKNLFQDLIIDLFKSYEGINFFIKRNPKLFKQTGRLQNLEESQEIDKKIKDILIKNDIIFYSVQMETAMDEILSILKTYDIY